jgi:hypothetical protein
MVSSGAIIGPLLSIISSIISTFGVCFQKIAHTENEAKDKKDQVDYVKMPKWWLGMSGVVLGAVGDFVALGLASQSVCTALGGATVLVSNVFIARYLLKEELSSLDLIGVVSRHC